MKARPMKIDFEGVPMHWAKEPTFATIINSGSIQASAFEPYLNRVMARARDTLPDSAKDLREMINIFIAQEGHHYRVHGALNKQLFKMYPRMKEFEDTMKAELKAQETTRSLHYNLAFCVGFENLATYISKFTFNSEDLYEGSDPRVAILFRWHNAEEFEHRSACHNALKAISNNWALRVGAFAVFLRYFQNWNKKILAYMHEIDRATMSSSEIERAIEFEKWYHRRFALSVFPQMARILLPGYDPGKQKAPPQLYKALEEFDRMVLLPEPIGARGAAQIRSV